MEPNQNSLRRKRSELTKRIREVNITINGMTQNNPNNQQYVRLHTQLLDLLTRKKETYINKTCDAYKKCINEIEQIERLLEEQNLTISVVATKNLELAQLDAAQLRALAQKKEQIALNKLEKIIKQKIQKLPQFFTHFNFEQLIIAQDNQTNNQNKQALEFLYELKTLWFSKEQKSLALLKQIESKSKQLITKIYAQWLEAETDPAHLNKSLLKKCNQLCTAMKEVIKTVEKHPAKMICYQTLTNEQKNRLVLITQYFELQKQLEKDSKKQTKVQLDATLGEILNNLTTEHTKANLHKPNATIIQLQEKRKQLKVEIQDDRCIIL